MQKTMSDDEILALYNKLQSQREVSKKLDMPKSTVNDAIQRARQDIYKESKVDAPRQINPYKHKTKRIIFTSAQDGTLPHENHLKNIIAFADFLDAELIIAGYTYNKNPFIVHKTEHSFSPLVAPYLSNDRINIGDNLTFCGEMNTLPTAVRPLSGLDSYTQHRDGIFPHAKVALASVATMKGTDAKINMTTGTVTVPNYIQKKSGQKATFHHVYGAVLVELMPDGTHFCRHLLGHEDDGSFYDLIYFVKDGVVHNMAGETVDAINYGDIHREKINTLAADMSFGDRDDSLLNLLKPKHQFLHDVTDGTARNHHNVKDPHFMFHAHINKEESVEADLLKTYNLLVDIQRPYTKTVVVESNHHTVLERWLKTADYKTDPVNSIFFLSAQLDTYMAIKEKNDDFDIYENVLKNYFGHDINDVHFIPEDGTYRLHDIEFGIHSHFGANGARGSALTFTKIGSKVNIGHGHQAIIMDGVYAAGVIGDLEMGYNKGVSSWSYSNIFTYASGKRTIVTMRNGLFHAPIDRLL